MKIRNLRVTIQPVYFKFEDDDNHKQVNIIVDTEDSSLEFLKICHDNHILSMFDLMVRDIKAILIKHLEDKEIKNDA